MVARFHIRQQGSMYRWQLVDHGEAAAEPRVLARSEDMFPTRGEANTAIERVRRAVIEADNTVVDATDPQSRWRKLTEDGKAGEPAGDDPPDNDDEGETGPPETTDGGEERL